MQKIAARQLMGREMHLEGLQGQLLPAQWALDLVLLLLLFSSFFCFFYFCLHVGVGVGICPSSTSSDG